ncbi:MAG: hypothetical protein HUK24_02475, partial [Sphaerochaetaceae bacterium]|nr:hypothetical protein [Sphaerochaetaceae bacterium]
FEPKTSGNFVFVEGKSGAAGYTSMVHGAQGSRLFYLPVGDSFGNMKVEASFAPYKEAGQGFGSATDQFLDIFIKFDRETMTGYAFRVQRLSADDVTAIGQNPSGAATGCAVSLVEYKDGVTTHISERVMTSAFMAVSHISVEAKDGVLTGTIYSTLEGARGGDGSGYAREVTLTAPYEENGFGGTGAICTGTSNPTLGTNCNYIMFLNWKTIWD